MDVLKNFIYIPSSSCFFICTVVRDNVGYAIGSWDGCQQRHLNDCPSVVHKVIGRLSWIVSTVLRRYSGGQVSSYVDKYLLPSILVIVIVPIAPSIFHAYSKKVFSKR